MLKSNNLTSDIESRAADTLHALLVQVPAIEVLNITRESSNADQRPDIVANFEVSGKHHMLIGEVKSTGQPRYVRVALLQLSNYMLRHPKSATPIFIAPYLSPESQALCREQNVGFLDFEGNAYLAFDGVFIERQVVTRPVADRRELKSLFKPKSAQILRVMLRDPHKAWRVTELAEAAGVSLGHVSNVRAGLLDREWAQVSDDGLFLSNPDLLLDTWRDTYEPPAGKRFSFYTTLHGSAFEDAARHALSSDTETGLAAFASYSAAHWLAPYGRTGTQYFYTDQRGLDRLRSNLKLTSATKGENVVITVLKYPELLRDTDEPAPGAVCTSPTQTYLDLANAGERGREAADHLRREKLTWLK